MASAPVLRRRENSWSNRSGKGDYCQDGGKWKVCPMLYVKHELTKDRRLALSVLWTIVIAACVHFFTLAFPYGLSYTILTTLQYSSSIRTLR